MSLDCQCRGELALRHRTCAEKWSRVKVSTTITHTKCNTTGIHDGHSQ